MHPNGVVWAAAAVFGLIFGSFFNVAIYRWPQEDPKEHEWIKNPSHCPRCQALIKWYDNIPVLSWLLLRGKCRNCQGRISPRYLFVELGTAALWVFTVWLTTTYGLTGIPPSHIRPVHIICAVILASLYMLTIIIDAETQIIPDEITIPHLLVAWIFFFLARPDTISPNWISSLICTCALPAMFFALAWMGWMGMGDVVLAAGFGALFGWPMSAVVCMLGFMLGGIVAVPMIIYLKLRGKYKMGTHAIAFGPYLAVSAFVCLFFGKEIVQWYFHLFGLQVNPNWTVSPLALLGL